MFRRFGVITGDESKEEILLNLNHITEIYKTEGQTYITMINGNEYESEIDYKHLADALDGLKF